MKRPNSPLLNGCLALATLLSILPADAGFSSRRLGITSVPVGGESSDKDILEIADRQGKHYPPINVPVPAADLVTLQGHPTFAGKSNADINTKVVNIRRAVLCAIDLLRRTDPETAQGLHNNFRAGTLCIGLAPSNYHVGAAIHNDGKKAFNLEPINLYKIPCTKLTEGSPELFDLLNTLAHEGLHGRQDVLGWREAPPLEVAKDRQCKEIEASQGELERAEAMCRVIEQIESNGTLPSDSRGLYARMGATILQEAAVNPGGLAEAISKWKRLLGAIKARAGEVKIFRESFKEAAELALNGSPDAQAVLEGLRRHRLFQYYGNTNEFRPITRWYQSRAPRIVTSPGGTPEVEGNNEMRQLYQPRIVPETFNVTPLDTICTGYISDDQNLALIGGISFGSGPGGVDEAVVVGYDIDPATGRIMVETERDLVRSTEMAGGYQMNYNPFDGKYYAIQFGNNAICCLDDTTGNGEPDTAVPCGSLGRFPDDFDPGRFGFSDAHTIFADGFESGTTSSWSDPVLSGSRPSGGGIFTPNPREEVRDSLECRPGFAGGIFVNSHTIPVAGSPGGFFELFINDVLTAQGCFSPKGYACPILESPPGPGDTLRLVDPDSGAQSVPVSPSPSLDTRFPIDIDVYSEPDGGIEFGGRIQIRHAPDQLIEIHHGPGIDSINDNIIPGAPSNRFGDSFFYLPPGESPKQFFRGVGGPHPDPIVRPDEIFFIPGQRSTFDLSLNDDVASSALYEVVARPIPQGNPDRILSETDFKLFPDGTIVTSMPTFASELQFSYRIRIGNQVTQTYVATIHAITSEDPFRNPTQFIGDNLNVYVEALVIHIDGHTYPAYQFVLGPPEPVESPTQGCPDLHWHKFNGSAYAIDFPDFVGIPDLIQSGCGYGTISQLPLQTAIVPLEVWNQFLIDHP